MTEQDWSQLVCTQYRKCGFKLHLENEWTILAGIVLIDETGVAKVVAVGAGVKCLPLTSYQGGTLRNQLVRDSHAEVLARRALKAYLYFQIKEALAERPSIVKKSGSLYELGEGVRFGMYISQSPCGDASMNIFDGECATTQIEKPAKCPRTIRGRSQIALRGVLRTKPGRADAPLSASLSCTDKIALWSLIGWQGAVLSQLIPKPIVIKEFFIGERFDEKTLRDSIIKKSSSPSEQDLGMLFKQSNFVFEFSRQKVSESLLDRIEKLAPASVGQVWFEGGRPEWIVDGRRLGSVKPKNNTLPTSCQSCISTARLHQDYVKLSNPTMTIPSASKLANREYQELKAKLFLDENSPFYAWISSNPAMNLARKQIFSEIYL